MESPPASPLRGLGYHRRCIVSRESVLTCSLSWMFCPDWASLRAILARKRQHMVCWPIWLMPYADGRSGSNSRSIMSEAYLIAAAQGKILPISGISHAEQVSPILRDLFEKSGAPVLGVKEIHWDGGDEEFWLSALGRSQVDS